MFEHSDVASHPGMHVTFHRYGNLLTGETLFERRHPRRLRPVPFPVVSRKWMNIVRSGVAVYYSELLVSLQCDDVRMINTGLLIDDGGFCRRSKLEPGSPSNT